MTVLCGTTSSMSDRDRTGELYDEAVGDGDEAPAREAARTPLVVESNASNYGASSLPTTIPTVGSPAHEETNEAADPGAS